MLPSDDVDKLWPLFDIQEKLTMFGITVSLSQLQEWENRHQNREGGIGFPDPERTLGKYKLYNLYEVAEWIILWRRATVRMGRGAELNGER